MTTLLIFIFYCVTAFVFLCIRYILLVVWFFMNVSCFYVHESFQWTVECKEVSNVYSKYPHFKATTSALNMRRLEQNRQSVKNKYIANSFRFMLVPSNLFLAANNNKRYYNLIKSVVNVRARSFMNVWIRTSGENVYCVRRIYDVFNPGYMRFPSSSGISCA